MLRSLAIRFFDAALLFRRKKGYVLAAASSFYISVATIPLMLLLIRLTGLFLGDGRLSEQHLFSLATNLFPTTGPQFLIGLKHLIEGLLFAGVGYTWINFVILLFSAYAFLNSIWGGLYLLSNDRVYLSHAKYLKGLLIILFTILVLTLLLLLPTLVMILFSVLKNSVVIDYISTFVPEAGELLVDFLTIGPVWKFILKSNLLHGFVFLLYFTLLYRWIFSGRISYKIAALGAFTFVMALLLGRNLFLCYVLHVRSRLVLTYGDYYVLIVVLLWVFLVMCFFFYGASLCQVCVRRERQLERQFALYWYARLRGVKRLCFRILLSLKRFRSIMRGQKRREGSNDSGTY